MSNSTHPSSSETASPTEITLYEYHCKNCRQSFLSQTRAIKHLWDTHSEESADSLPLSFRCGGCSGTFQDISSLDEHLEEHISDDFSPTCSQCQAEFSSEDAVQEHFRQSHAIEYATRKYCCPICDATFSSPEGLLLSHFLNTPDHPVTAVLPEYDSEHPSVCPLCEEYCELADKRGMVQHTIDAHDIPLSRVYECDRCDSILQNGEDAINHVASSHLTQEEPISTTCPDCSQVFSDNDADAHRNHYRDVHLPCEVVCPDCQTSAPLSNQDTLARHYWTTHSLDSIPLEFTHDVTVSRQKLLQSLYCINKNAKKHRDRGTENYRNGKKTAAKVNSVKKGALYGVKENVLQRIWPTADNIEIHHINGEKFYLVDFSEVSFHAPVSSLVIPQTEVRQTHSLTGFTSGSAVEKTSRSLKASLTFFHNRLSVNANNFLSQEYVYFGRSKSFTGWSYLE